MRRVSVTELKNQLSRYLRLVKNGETIEIVERSLPIARLEAMGSSRPDERLERLERDGIVQPARAKARADLIERTPVPCRGDAVDAVLKSRGDR